MQAPFIAFSDGAEITAANLVSMRNFAPLLPPSLHKKILNDMSGSYASKLRGRGMDYAEIRQYQAGDDLRNMDWRVTARTGEAHIKVFHEEKERPVLLVCDLRENMHFGSKRALKSVVAADLTALLAWTALNAGDRIGALLFNDEIELDIRPKTGRKAVMRVLNELINLQRSQLNTNKNRLLDICKHLHRVARPGSRIYIISDWYGFNDECQRHLFSVSQHCEIIGFHISDPLEKQLPPPGIYPISDGQYEYLLNSAPQSMRDQYTQAFMENLQTLKQSLMTLRIPLINISTELKNPLANINSGTLK